MLEREDVLWGVAEIVERLDGSEARITLSLIGGAAMVLQHSTDRGSTSDIAAWITGSIAARRALEQVVGEIADERGWPADWLNDRAAKNAFIPEGVEPDEFTVILTGKSVTVRVADARLMFAMKLHAARGRRDFDDLDVLVGLCAVESRSEAVEIFERAYPDHELKPSACRWLDATFSPSSEPPE